MEIKSHTKKYQVNLYTDFTPVQRIIIDKDSYIVIDKVLYDIYVNRLFADFPKERLYILEATENNKVIESVLSICEKMTGFAAKRNVKLISFGGGIIQDITGFVANILYRGIHWTFFPTTLLAACDSCIGGKTSLNYKKFKNLLGTFYPPDSVNICTPFFQTLSDRDFESGLGEVVKFNVMYGEAGVNRIEKDMDALLARDPKTVLYYVESSLNFKKPFIEADEFDRGVRIQLNFAHTFGHAFETMSNYDIPHGTAVAMGTIVANHISLERGWLDEELVLRIEAILKQIIHIAPLHFDVNCDVILQAIHKDKKQTSDQITAVLMKDDMKLLIVHDVQEKEVREAVSYMFNLLK